MRDNKEYVLIARSTSTFQKWKQTISRRGMKVEKQQQRIARCFVGIAIEQSRESRKNLQRKT